MKTVGGADVSLGGADTLRPDGAPLGRIDQYELVRELGGGGFGVVYLARDTVAGVDVAVKGLPPLVKNNAEEMERIRENFALVSKLHHPNIAAALVLHPARSVSYADERVRQALRVLPGDTLLVMTFAPGVTLNKWRRQFPDGRVPVPQALEVCRQIAAALDYAHREKVVHRDVKPSNVMIESLTAARGDARPIPTLEGECPHEPRPHEPQVRVRVLDFGLAAEIRSSMSRVSQEKGDTSGTRPYMAPEQWAGRRQDGRTDQYALAVLFYELVSGAVPFASAFDTGDPVIMANAAKTEPPEPLAALSKAQNAALLRGLAKEPGDRFASCGEFVAALGGTGFRGHTEAAKTSVKKAALTLAVLAALAAVSVLSIRSIQSYRARQAEARTVAEQAAAQDAAEQARLDDLRRAAEAALAAGDLETAGAKIAELKSTGELKNTGGRVSPRAASSRAAEDLQRRYESKAGERETNRRYAAASLAREKALKLERGQGFGAKLETLEVTWREAEAARQGQGWGQALSGYDAVLAACEALEKEEASRKAAKTRREESEKAKQAAEQAGSESDANELFSTGGRASSRAAGLFEKGSFDGADKAWQEAADAYAAAKTRAEAAAKPKLTLECNVSGARIADGQREYDAPCTFTLDPDTRYRFVVSKESTESNQSIRSKRYKSATLEITADWKGPKTQRVELEEVKAPQLGEVQTVDLGGGVRLELVWCPPGNFLMGSPEDEAGRDDDEAQHRVTVTKGFWLGKYEVTQAQWEAVMGSNPSHFKNAGPNAPVESVSWDDCKAFVQKLNSRIPSGGFRLPTEAEWEYACRAGTTARFSFGDLDGDLHKYGNYCERSCTISFGWKDMDHTDGYDKTAPVGVYRPNAWGLYDMHGNVWEWCQDRYGAYPVGNVNAPSGSDSGSFRVYRGGSWCIYARYCRSAGRHRNASGFRFNDLGLRLARDSQVTAVTEAAVLKHETEGNLKSSRIPVNRASSNLSSRDYYVIIKDNNRVFKGHLMSRNSEYVVILMERGEQKISMQIPMSQIKEHGYWDEKMKVSVLSEG